MVTWRPNHKHYDPYNPTNVSSITDGTRYPTLNGSISITTATIGGSTYELACSICLRDVQIINIDDPYNPTNVSSITDGTLYPTLNVMILLTLSPGFPALSASAVYV